MKRLRSEKDRVKNPFPLWKSGFSSIFHFQAVIE